MSTKKNRKLKSLRRYSQAFKQARVDDFENGIFSVAQMSRLYGIQPGVIYNWIHKYSRQPKPTSIIVEVPNSQTGKVKQLEARIAHLEQALGKKQVELDFQKALLEEIKESGVDISRRDFFSQASSDSCGDTKD